MDVAVGPRRLPALTTEARHSFQKEYATQTRCISFSVFFCAARRRARSSSRTHHLSARKERVSLAKQSFQHLWDETAADRENKTEKALFHIYESNKCPFYSFYIFDDKVYVALYPFDRPGDLSSPVYVFPAGSSEYDRISREAETLIGFAQQSEPFPKPA